ncbi:hypothetical protein FRC14_005256 [Serendipita sp. 396]|nr:hypothetical protein FRC14_005256 [Serendipita sp. 396]
MFFCAISGEVPTDPVVAQPSGHVYERRLIEKYIAENGADPITGGKLELSDIITVKAKAVADASSAMVLFTTLNSAILGTFSC